MKKPYVILNVGAWLILVAVVASALLREGTVADSRSQTIVIGNVVGKSASLSAADQASVVELSPEIPSPLDSSAIVAERDSVDTQALPAAVALNDSGAVLLAAGQTETALALFQESISLDSTYARAFYNSGLAFQRLGRVKEAIGAYNRSIAIRPHYFRALYNIGALYYEIGSFEDAVTWMRKATEAKKSDEAAPAWYNLGLAYKRLDDMDKAVSTNNEAMRLRPGYPEPRYNLALIQMDQGKYAQAGREFERVAALGLKKKKLYNNLGICYSRQGKHAEAVAAYRKGLQIEPGDASGWFNLAIGLSRQQDTTGALDAYSHATRLDTAYFEAFFNAALLYSDRNKLDSAMLMYQRAVSANPSYSKARYNLALGHLNRDQYDSATVHFKAVTELDPENLKALYNLGVCYSKQEFLDEAALAYYQLLNHDPTNTKAINNLGTVLLKQEKYDSADVYFNRLVGLTKSPEAYFNRAKVRQELDSADAAMQDYRKAIELRPDYAKAFHNLAILEDKAGNQKVAIDLLIKATEFDTDNWKSYWKLGQIYAEMNDMSSARQAYAEAAKANPDSDKFRREYQTILQSR